MEKHTIKLLGKALRDDLALPEDLPFPVREALKALATAEGYCEKKAPLQRPIDILGLCIVDLHRRPKEKCGLP